MTVNTAFEGRSFELGGTYEVSEEAIRAFARATGSSHPSHVDAEAARELGYSGVVAPTTFPVILAQRSESAYIADPEAGIDFSRVVHGEERFTYTRPIVAGDSLAAATLVESIRGAGGHSMITTRTHITDAASGDAVVDVVSTIVVRGEA